MRLFKKILKIIDSSASNRVIKWIVFPCILLLLWLLLSMFYSSYKSLTVLQYAHSQDDNNNFFGKKLLKDQKLKGEFSAKDNYLGIVAVRFGNVPRVDFENEDIILFRIKEKNNKEWLYENKYRLGGFTSNQFYPFGFKEIISSKGKVYEFEIVSKKGYMGNSLETKHTNPIYLSKYKYPKSEVFKDINSVIKFMKEKAVTFVTNSDSLLSSMVFVLPFIFYVGWILFLPTSYIASILLPSERWIKRKGKVIGKILFTILISLLIISEIIFYEFLITGFMLGLLGLLIFSSYINRLKSNVTFVLSFVLLIISVFSMYFNFSISVDKATTYVYLLLVIGFFQSIYERK